MGKMKFSENFRSVFISRINTRVTKVDFAFVLIVLCLLCLHDIFFNQLPNSREIDWFKVFRTFT